MSLLFDLWLTSRLSASFLDDAMADSELSPLEYAVYSLIGVHGPTTPRQLERWTGMPATTVSAMLTRMDDRGHLQRRANPDDGRSTLLALGAAGQRATARAREHFRPALEEITSRLGEQVPAVRTALRRLDSVLRDALAVGAHPGGDVESADVGGATLAYDGPLLTPAQEDEARRFVEWLRARDHHQDAVAPGP